MQPDRAATIDDVEPVEAARLLTAEASIKGFAASETRPANNKRKLSGDAWDLANLSRPLPARRRRNCPQRPRLLPHYPAVVRFVYDNRYATGDQVQRRFAAQMRSARTAQYQLARLVELGYLATAPARSTSPNFPYVFSASTAGVRFLRKVHAAAGSDWRGVATERHRRGGVALQSLLHELLLTEFDHMVWQTVRRRGDLERLFVQRRYFRREHRLQFDAHGRQLSVVPDSGFLLRRSSAIETSRLPNAPVSPTLLLHLTELDNGTMSVARVAQKLRRYESWFSSIDARESLEKLYLQHGALPRRPSFRLLLIAHDKDAPGGDLRRLTEILAQVLDLSSSFRRQVWLTTAENLRFVANRRSPLDEPIWWRARDANAWLPDYRDLPRGRGPAREKLRRQFVSDNLHQLPLHPLFGRRRLHSPAEYGTLTL